MEYCRCFSVPGHSLTKKGLRPGYIVAGDENSASRDIP